MDPEVMQDALNHLNAERLQLLLALAQAQRTIKRLEEERDTEREREVRAGDVADDRPQYPRLDVPPVV